MTKAYKERIRASKSRLDTEMREFARAWADSGNIAELLKAKFPAIDHAYADQLEKEYAMNAGWLPDRTRNAKPQGYSVQLQADGSYAVFYGSDFRKGGFRTYGDAGLWARDRIDEEEMQSAEEWSNDPDDGHDHDFTDDVAGLPDTGTDATTVICTKCGMLSAQEPEE